MREGWALEFMINVAQSIGRFECIYLYSVKLREFTHSRHVHLCQVWMRWEYRNEPLWNPMENVGWHESGDG